MYAIPLTLYIYISYHWPFPHCNYYNNSYVETTNCMSYSTGSNELYTLH